MQGDLRTTSLEQLCRTLGDRGATGELTVAKGDANVSVAFLDGAVVRATTSGPQMRIGDRLVHGGLLTPQQLTDALSRQGVTPLGELLVTEGLVNRHVVRVFMQEQILDSLFAAFRWTFGTYEFAEVEVEEPDVPSHLTVDQLIFALESRHRRWNEITRTIPSMAAVPELVPGADPSSANLEQGEQSIVKAINGESSLERIATRLGYGPFEVATVIHGLTVLGLVRLQEPVPSPDAEEAPSAEPEPAVEAPDTTRESASDALAEAASLLLGDEPTGAEAAPEVALQVGGDDEDDGELGFTIEMDDEVSEADTKPVVTSPPPEPMPSVPSFANQDEDDEDISPWAFTIEGESDEPDEPEEARPRRSNAAPITAGGVVADTTTGTPLPVETEPSATEEPEAEAPEPAAPPAEPPRPRTGEMSDLLRELRQLSSE